MTRKGWVVLVAVAAAAVGIDAQSVAAQQDGEEYARSTAGTRALTLGSGTAIKMLLDASNFGGTDIEVGEITFPAGQAPGGAHRHGSTEIFYVVEGVLGHVVNGEMHRLEPGMVGLVKPTDMIAHQVLEGPVKAVVIWLPGGESTRIAPLERWTPIGG